MVLTLFNEQSYSFLKIHAGWFLPLYLGIKPEVSTHDKPAAQETVCAELQQLQQVKVEQEFVGVNLMFGFWLGFLAPDICLSVGLQVSCLRLQLYSYFTKFT